MEKIGKSRANGKTLKTRKRVNRGRSKNGIL
jgi:hypothetical protein